MNIRTTSALLAFGVTLLPATSADAQSVTENTRATGPAEVFGAAGQIAISSDAALLIQRRTLSGVEGGTTQIQLAPAADYFVITNLSVGGFVGFDYTTSGENESSRFSIGPRVGYNIPFSDLISIWPKVGFSFAHTSTTATRTTGNTTVSTTNSADAFALNLFAPVVFHPVRHFFAGFGPFLDVDISGDPRATVFGGKLTIGGWM
jgi:streptogramin lyase